MSDTAVLPISILAAAIPTMFYVLLIYVVDRYEKEPLWLLGATFLWGAVPSILVAYVFNTLLGLPVYALAGGGLAGETAVATIVAPVVEETIKGVVLLGIFIFWRHEIDSPLDGIIYGAMVGFGFAMVENVYYFLNEYNVGGLEAWSLNVFLRSIIFGLNHALFTSMTGLGIAVARLSPNTAFKIIAPFLGWSAAVFLHFMHNLTVSLGSVLICFTFIFDWGGVWLILLIILWALIQERSWIKQYLAEEIQVGTMTPRQYEVAYSGHRRMLFSLEMLFTRGFKTNRHSARFFHRCSELAYKKHHYTLFRDEKSARSILRLRHEIHQLSQKL
ncbi:MAG: PrsW family intramembrane metalloprotease [Chloroflexi bacterium]|nr:PrsW family intramembrane metalloprotease [Chloroflexota bacterium]